MGGVINFFFPIRKNYWTLKKINFTIVFLTIQSLGINFKISQNLLIWHLKKSPQKTRCNTNKSRKIKFFGEMNLTIRFLTPKKVGINLNTINYLSLWPPKKLWKIIRFFSNLFCNPQSQQFFGCATPPRRHPDIQGVAQPILGGSRVEPPYSYIFYKPCL